MSRADETICQVARDEMGCISELFSDWQETMIWSCLQGYMGEAYAAGFSGAGFQPAPVGSHSDRGFLFLCRLTSQGIACQGSKVP